MTVTATPLFGQPPSTPVSPPPDDLLPESFAARLYAMLAPLAQEDDQTGWSLLTYLNAHGTMYQLVEDLVRDTPYGPGWSVLLDLPRCPDYALPWLGQLVGVRVLPGSTPDEQRARILATDGFRRGTVAAMKGAAIATLINRKRIDFRERSGGPLPETQIYAQITLTFPDYASVNSNFVDYQHLAGSPDAAYYVKVRTYASDTPDPAATLRALISQKPGGLVLDYAAITGQTYGDVKARYATYADVTGFYTDYLAVKQDEPP